MSYVKFQPNFEGQFLYNTAPYNMDLDIAVHVVAPNLFSYGILQKNDRKTIIKWSFSYNSFAKLCVPL